MHTASSVSNVGYYALKKKAGLHNQGFLSGKDNALLELEEMLDGVASISAWEELET